LRRNQAGVAGTMKPAAAGFMLCGPGYWPLFGGGVVVVVVLWLVVVPGVPGVTSVPAGGVAGGVAPVVSAGAPVVPPMVPLVPDVLAGGVVAGAVAAGSVVVVVVVVLVGSVFLQAASAPAMKAAISKIFGALLSAFIIYSSFTSILCRWPQVRRWSGSGARLVPPWPGGHGSRTVREPAHCTAPFSARIRLCKLDWQAGRQFVELRASCCNPR
jgi:hypothetical protein